MIICLKKKNEKNYDDIDAHNCKDHVDVLGYCQFCGAVVYGTMAYEELYGGE